MWLHRAASLIEIQAINHLLVRLDQYWGSHISVIYLLLYNRFFYSNELILTPLVGMYFFKLMFLSNNRSETVYNTYTLQKPLN